MTDKIIRFADEHDMLPRSGTVVACVSGGADSMCLLTVLADISKERGFTVCAAHFNHMLRGGESDNDEAFVGDYCAKNRIAFFADRGDVSRYARAHGLGAEEAARDMRYRFFYATAEKTGAARIATAHTVDDNAETVLMNLIRGAGTSGLSGIPPRRDIIVRPMLSVSRRDVLCFLEARGVPYVEDSTNSLDIYTRNKLRHKILPLIREINPRFSEAAAAASALTRADEELLSELAERFIREQFAGDNGNVDNGRGDNGGGVSSALLAGLPFAEPPVARPAEQFAGDNGNGDNSRNDISRGVSSALLAGLPFAVSGRALRKLSGVSLSHKHVEAVLSLCRRGGPPASVSLPGMTAYIEYGRVTFARTANSAGCSAVGFEPVRPAPGAVTPIASLGLEVSYESFIYGPCAAVPESPGGARGRINKSFTSFLFKYDDVCGRITVRPRREGDSIRLKGGSGARTLKKLFIDRRIPARERALIPVIADEAGVLAVFGIGPGCRAVPAPGDRVIRLAFQSRGAV